MSDTTVASCSPTIGLFPGQGSQYPGMGMSLVSRYRVAAEVFDESSDALHIDMRSLCWSAPKDFLGRTDNAQIAIVTVSIAAWRVWTQELSETPVHAVAGQSVGAMSAAIAGGYLGLSDGLRLTRKRGLFMSSAPGHGAMLAVATASGSVREAALHAAEECGLEIAVINGARQIVLSGDAGQIQAAHQLLGAKSIRVNVSHAFHSKMMDPIMKEWTQALEKTPFHEGTLTVLSSTCSEELRSAEQIREDLRWGVRRTVRWDYVLKSAEQYRTWVYLGTARQLSQFCRQHPHDRAVHIIDETNTKVR